MSPSMASVITRPRAGVTEVADDIESEEERHGYEPDDRLTALLARLCADGDRRAQAAGRRAPRTVAEMTARLRAVAQVCCGHPMDQDGQQLVCRRCGAWIDPGATPPPATAARGGQDDGDGEPRTGRPDWILDAYAAPRGEQACGACGGAGGQTEETSDGGVTRQTWHRCGACGGTGVAR